MIRARSSFVYLAAVWLVACSAPGRVPEVPAGDAGVSTMDGGAAGSLQVVFLTPSDAASVSGMVDLRVSVQGAITSAVEFLVDDQHLSTAMTAPYTAQWNAGAAPYGHHRLSARATTPDGKSGLASIQVLIASPVGTSGGPPVIRFVSPAAETSVCGTVPFEASVTSDVGLLKVEFLVDGTSLGAISHNGPFTLDWPTAMSANGSHDLYLVATDTSGQQTQETRHVTVANVSGSCDNAPSVLITQPVANTVSGATVAIEARATDDVGVVKVQFFIDGNLIQEATQAPYRATWNTQGFAAGFHTLKALAYDTANQTASDTRTLTWSPGGLTVSLTTPAPNASVAAGPVTFTAAANSLDGVTSLKILVDNALIGSSPFSPYSVTTALAPGQHSAQAQAQDGAGHKASSDVTTFMVASSTNCLSKYDCSSSLICVGGHCQTPPSDGSCLTDSQCPRGEVCTFTRQCTAGCSSSQDCNSPQICNQSTVSCGYCSLNNPCPSGQTCANNQCSPSTSCSILQSCATGLICTQASVCANCSSDAACVSGFGSGTVCNSSGLCATSAGCSDASCQQRLGSHLAYCDSASNSCQQYQCVSSSDCAAPATCVNHACSGGTCNAAQCSSSCQAAGLTCDATTCSCIKAQPKGGPCGATGQVCATGLLCGSSNTCVGTAVGPGGAACDFNSCLAMQCTDSTAPTRLCVNTSNDCVSGLLGTGVPCN
jgi:hypothetical protein